MTSFFKNLFGKSKPAALLTDSLVVKPKPSEPATIPVGKPIELAEPLEPWPISPQIAVGWGQSVGQQRDHNEDAIFIHSSMLISDNQPAPFGLFIVADGMGGHQHGEIASGMAIRAMATHVLQNLYIPIFSPVQESPDESLQEIMQAGIFEAHRAILKHAPGGGTTLTAMLVMGDQMTVTHVGDSRAYLISYPDYQIQPLTRDHSLVKRLEELGQLTPEEAAQHPQRNVLYRALGQGEPFEPDINSYPLPLRGYVLLCSDGLWGIVPEKDIIRLINSTPDLHIVCQRLMEAANKAGGPDNISAILIRLTQ